MPPSALSNCRKFSSAQEETVCPSAVTPCSASPAPGHHWPPSCLCGLASCRHLICVQSDAALFWISLIQHNGFTGLIHVKVSSYFWAEYLLVFFKVGSTNNFYFTTRQIFVRLARVYWFVVITLVYLTTRIFSFQYHCSVSINNFIFSHLFWSCLPRPFFNLSFSKFWCRAGQL